MSGMAKACIYLTLVAVGVLGLYFKIEYSGWILLVGLIGVIDL